MNPATYQAAKAMLKADSPSAEQAAVLARLLPGHAPQLEPRDRLVTASEAAKILGVCTRQVSRWAALGRLPAATLGRRCVRYRESDVFALIASAFPTTTAAA